MTGARALRVLIVDDEALARQRLEDLVRHEPNVEIVGTADNGNAAVTAIRSLRPDLVFLDVQMPGRTGIEVVREIGPQNMPATIFVTAYDQYALHAFEVAAVDYLVKPFDDERFGRALDRARARIEAARRDGAGAGSPSRWLEKFAIECAGRISIVPVETVEWIEAQDYYVQLHARGKEHLLRETLRNLETRLDPRRFARVHRSAIVNVECVKQLRRRTHGEYVLVLDDGTELKLSRTHRDQLQLLLGHG